MLKEPIPTQFHKSVVLVHGGKNDIIDNACDDDSAIGCGVDEENVQAENTKEEAFVMIRGVGNARCGGSGVIQTIPACALIQ